MIRNLVLFVLFAVCLLHLGGCEEQPSPATTQPSVAIEKTIERGPVKVILRLEKDQVAAGERLPMVIEVIAAREVDVKMPAIDETLGSFEVLDPQTPPDIPEGDQRRWTHRYSLRTFEIGEQTLPPINVEFTDRRVTDGSAEPIESEFATPELTVTVTTSLAGEFDPTQFRDIKGAVEVEVPRGTWPWWWGVVAIVAAGAAWMLWRRMHHPSSRPKQVEPLLPPHVWANRELDRLAADGLIARGQIQPFYFRLSNIVRQYIERRFSIMAAEQTTEEFLREARRHPSLNLDQQRSLGEFLRGADMVKFAKYQPDPADCEAALGSARQFVRETTPQNVPESQAVGVAA